MEDNERDEVLTDIQVNSAITREKVEKMEDTLQDVQSRQDEHGDRLNEVEQTSSQNRYVIAGTAGTVVAGFTAIISEVTKWIL